MNDLALRDGARVQAVAGRAGCSFEETRGKGGHIFVRRGDQVATLPMRGSGKELGSGLVSAIKKQLGLQK